MTNKLLSFDQKDITNRIFTFRSIPVMIDRDLAELYGVETKRLNEQVKRNIERFPDSFRFQLSVFERDELVANCDRFIPFKHSTAMPYVFTEQGVAMLSAILRSETAIKVSIQIINAFIEMRKNISSNMILFQRIDKIEFKQLEAEQKFEHIFNALEGKIKHPDKGIFYDGEIFDSYIFISDLIRNANKNIILIDNYIDETVLLLLTKRKKGVGVTIYSKHLSKQLQLDLNKHNEQYESIEIKLLNKSHDRFLIIDKKELYHIGASLKDLGKKWFAFSRMDSLIIEVLNKLI